MKIDHSVLVLVIFLVTGNDYIISGNGKAKAEETEEIVETVSDEDFCDNCTFLRLVYFLDGASAIFSCKRKDNLIGLLSIMSVKGHKRKSSSALGSTSWTRTNNSRNTPKYTLKNL